jgi:hypothetical protein
VTGRLEASSAVPRGTSLLPLPTRRRPISAAVRHDLQASGNLALFTHSVENTAHQAR